MNRKLFGLIAALLVSAGFVSCSDDESNNPFDEQRKGDFCPKEIVIKKNNESRKITESWKNIKRDYKNNVISYDYSYELDGQFTQVENRSCTLDYYKEFNGNEVIRAKTNVDYTKSDRGITEKYTENILETAYINSAGYIVRIDATTDHFDGNSTDAVIEKSERTFKYSGDLCTESTYNDNEYSITYKYKWSGYELKNITVLKENKKDGSVEYSTYEYTFNKKEIYPYTGCSPMPFIQSGMPQIYASMGYLGKCTPYILAEELRGGYTKFDGDTFDNTKVHLLYNLTGDASTKLTYSALTSKNIYEDYTITFSK